MPSILPTNATQNITGMKSYVDYLVNDVASGWIFPPILFGLFIIIFMLFKGNSTNGKAFAGTSFIIMVFAILLSVLNWLAPMYMYATIVMTGIGAVWAYLENANE
jgi:hypothetical protein